jgi:hypothetical protein
MAKLKRNLALLMCVYVCVCAFAPTTRPPPGSAWRRCCGACVLTRDFSSKTRISYTSYITHKQTRRQRKKEKKGKREDEEGGFTQKCVCVCIVSYRSYSLHKPHAELLFLIKGQNKIKKQSIKHSNLSRINQSIGNSSPLCKSNGVNPPSPHGANTASAVVNKPCATTPSTLSISAWI